jgi:hypothetical protein
MLGKGTLLQITWQNWVLLPPKPTYKDRNPQHPPSRSKLDIVRDPSDPIEGGPTYLGQTLIPS